MTRSKKLWQLQEKEIGKVESVIVMPEGSLTVPRVEE